MQRLRIIQVDPGELRLPPNRSAGADPLKLHRQIGNFGSSTEGMPPIQVTEGAHREWMINDGVTRATRICQLSPGTTISAEVIEVRPNWDLSTLPKIKETI